MANFNKSTLMTVVTVLAAALSMVNLAYDASMINSLLLSSNFQECMSKFCYHSQEMKSPLPLEMTGPNVSTKLHY